MTPSQAAQEKPTSPNDQSSAGSSQSTSPRTEAGAELIFYLRGALIAYPNDRAEAILAGAREYIVRIEREATAATPSLDRDLLAEAIFESGVRQTMSQSEQAADNILAEIPIILARLDEGSATPREQKR